MSAIFSRGFGNVPSRRKKSRAVRFRACVAEQLEARGMLSGIGIAVTPPLVPANTDSPVVIAAPPATASGSASSPVTLPVVRDPVVTLPVVRESLRIAMPSQVRAGVPINVTAVAVDAAGFIYGLLSGASEQEAVNLGWAHGALLTTFPGDTTMSTVEQVKAFAKGGSARIQR